MFSLRGKHSPQDALDLANGHLENARKSDNPSLVLTWCVNAEVALSRIKRSERKALTPPKTVKDQVLCERISTAYIERGKLLNIRGHHDKARASFKIAEKWRYVQDTDGKFVHPQPSAMPFSIDRAFKPSVAFAFAAVADQPNPGAEDKPICSDALHVAPEIFSHNVAKPAVKYDLPKPDERITSTPQLVYCLKLLSRASSLPPSPSSPSSPSLAAELDEALDECQHAWILATSKDKDEQERLRSLVTELIVAFIDDDLKDTSTVAEIVHLAPVLEQDRYRKLLGSVIDGIGQSTLLDFDLLEGLAQLLQNTPPTYLLPDNLVKILEVLSQRLQKTHQQSLGHLYKLSVVVSRVLDAMADCGVEGLNREQLHEPLSAYLKELKGSSDSYLVYQAAYAYQALQYVPNDETSLQAVLRRSHVVVTGISGFVSAAKALDLSGCLDGLARLHEGLGEVYDAAMAGYEGATSLIKNGQSLMDGVKEGFSFSRKRTWYPTLRAIDILLQCGQLADFKKLVYDAPCRRDPEFEWGICQRLGEVAAKPGWDADIRCSAVKFLGEMYKDDADWGQEVSIKQLIIAVLTQLSALPDITIKSHAHTVLQDIGTNGDAKKQALYHACRRGPPSPYPLNIDLPPLASSSLISLIQDIPDVEDDLRKLKKRRLKGRVDGVYIPPQAKADLQASNDAFFPLLENVKEFLDSDRQVLLLLGDSGAGKSTFNRELECELWSSYKKGNGRIPLHIHLPEIDHPDKGLIAKHLRENEFRKPQIREMKHNREFILICDGYDESRCSRNLYTSNHLNQPGQWKAKMIVSCRSEYLPQDYKNRFQPMDQNHNAVHKSFQEAVIVPFSKDQIRNYIEQYVKLVKPQWQSKYYFEALNKVPNLLDLVQNPFLLTLSLEVLSQAVDIGQVKDHSGTKITRVGLYDKFMRLWLERGKERARKSELSQQAKAAFDTLEERGFTQTGIDFLKRLGSAIYKEQAGRPVVQYSLRTGKETWKTEFFSREDSTQLLREACPLVRNGDQYQFMHQSLLEYCFSLVVFDPLESNSSYPPFGPAYGKSVDPTSSDDKQDVPEGEAVNDQQLDDDHPLTWRSFVNEPSILAFLVERVQQKPHFEQQLQEMIERSKTDKEGSTAAANAITILVKAGIQFNGKDLRGIRIPGADLSGGIFDSAQLQGADLSKVNLRDIWLRQADLSHARMEDVQFGEWPYLTKDSIVYSSAYSPDGENCAMGFEDGIISVYDNTTWDKLRSLRGHTDTVRSVVYSPSGQKIASGSHDMTVRLWDAQTGAPGHILSGHTDLVTSVAYSPSGQQIVSGSDDKTVRLWDAQTGTPGLILNGHTDSVTSVMYSPSGQQIASGSRDRTVRLWEAQTGAPGYILKGHTDWVTNVVYSPNGQQAASSSKDRTVRLWDAQTGALGRTVSGHTEWATSVVYSPNGQQIASGSHDKTVRLWEAHTGTPGPILRGHTKVVTSLVYSPSGQQIASASMDKTVRLWDAQTGAPGSTLSGHANSVNTVVHSPNNQQIASASIDNTVRLWDAQTGVPGPILKGFANGIQSVVYSPSSQQIASGGNGKVVQLWDAHTGKPGLTLSGHTGYITSVVYSPSGQQIASASGDKTVRLWNAHTGDLDSILKGHTDNVSSVAYSPKSPYIASGSYDKTVRLWKVHTGDPGPILDGHTDYVSSVVYSPNGQQIASGGDDMTVRLWDAKTGAPGPVLSGHTHWITSVVYSPNGQQIASASMDKTVRLWDAHTGDPGPILNGHTDSVSSVVYSPSGMQIASGNQDETVRLWDVVSGQCVAVVKDFHGPVNSLTWYGSYFATACDDNSVRIWQVVQGGSQCNVRLIWSSIHHQLAVSATAIHGVQGLSNINMDLLKQRGAVDKSIPPSISPGANEDPISTASTVSQLEIQSNHSTLNTSPEVNLSSL